MRVCLVDAATHKQVLTFHSYMISDDDSSRFTAELKLQDSRRSAASIRMTSDEKSSYPIREMSTSETKLNQRITPGIAGVCQLSVVT